jgi:REP element-mobilizing transposase RayT
MRYDPEKHHRRSIRLQGYDYSTPNAYFVTIVTQHREHLFGEIIDGQMHLNDAGQMIARWWQELERKFPAVQTDAWIMMPNHLHGIIRIHHTDPPGDGVSLATVVQWFKTMTTNEYLRHVKQEGWTPFPRRLWQRNYYEHIIRNPEELEAIRHYIITNPQRWAEDPER